MESMNRVELQGVVGNVRIERVAGIKMACFTLATDYSWSGKSGAVIIETTWHELVAFSDRSSVHFEEIKQGAHLHITGRLRRQVYVNQSGESMAKMEVLVESLEAVK